jgi:hypothetical protein
MVRINPYCVNFSGVVKSKFRSKTSRSDAAPARRLGQVAVH